MAFLEQNRLQKTDSGSNTADQGIVFSCKDIQGKKLLYVSRIFFAYFIENILLKVLTETNVLHFVRSSKFWVMIFLQYVKKQITDNEKIDDLKNK